MSCQHIEFLTTPRTVEGDKKQRPIKFLDMGQLHSFETGNMRLAPIMRPLVEGPSGKLSVGRGWLEVKFCPVCGEAVTSAAKQPERAE